MPEFDMMGDLKKRIELSIFRKLSEEHKVPEEVIILVEKLVEAGCPIRCVLDGLSNFGETMAFMELVKDLNFGEEKEHEQTDDHRTTD